MPEDAEGRGRITDALTAIRCAPSNGALGVRARGRGSPGGGDAGLKSHQVPLAVSLGLIDTLHTERG